MAGAGRSDQPLQPGRLAVESNQNKFLADARAMTLFDWLSPNGPGSLWR
jgi:hypothetical protein